MPNPLGVFLNFPLLYFVSPMPHEDSAVAESGIKGETCQ